MKLGMKEKRNAQTYAQESPKQLGNLHQRMKFVIRALEEARGWKTSEPDPEFDNFYHDLVFGIFDLETEVKFYKPAKPPFARRQIPLLLRRTRSSLTG